MFLLPNFYLLPESVQIMVCPELPGHRKRSVKVSFRHSFGPGLAQDWGLKFEPCDALWLPLLLMWLLWNCLIAQELGGGLR